MRVGDRIYYTGDIANADGWFRVAAVDGKHVRLVEMEGRFSEDREMTISEHSIGQVYKGHCNPRFVTEAAYDAYFAERGVQ